MSVSLTFDVDGEAGLACRPGSFQGRLSSVSEARFGIARGLERVLAALAAHGARATFYAPGITVERDPPAFQEILAGGHEIAHHGYRHLPSHRLDAAAQRDELERGLHALADRLALVPAGYRSPAWELTPATHALLREHRFTYDSSLMGDDRPYRLGPTGHPAQPADPPALIELPVHWSLDDVPYFAWTPDTGGRPADPAHVLALWIAEHDHATREQRHITYTMHPEIIGRAHRIDLLHRLLDHLHTHQTPIETHEQVARGL